MRPCSTTILRRGFSRRSRASSPNTSAPRSPSVYRRGKLYRSRAGEVISWKTPYGYRRVPRGSDGPARLVIFEPEAEVVRRIFDDYVAGGHSTRQIVKRLARDDVTSPTGKTMWGTSTFLPGIKEPPGVPEAFVDQVTALFVIPHTLLSVVVSSRRAADGRGWHDRIAGTEVVTASARRRPRTSNVTTGIGLGTLTVTCQPPKKVAAS